MKKCLLCERKMSGSNNFGKGCLKNMYHIMGIYEPKSIKTEQILNEEILKLCNKKELPEEQSQLLVDRYLTLNGILQGGVGLLLVARCDLSAKLLEHSLKSNPEDVLITEEKYVNKIKENDNFRKKINSIILKYGENDNFDTGSKKESLTFETGDLKLSIHNAYIQVKGNKNLNWNLDIELTDIYDFTDLQELEKYIKGGSYISSTIVATANNLAMIATSCNVVHKYNVTIRFKLKDWKWFNE